MRENRFDKGEFETDENGFEINENGVLVAYHSNTGIFGTIIIPDKVIKIGDSAFGGYIAVKRIILPEGLISIGAAAFGYCKSLVEINLPETLTSIEAIAFDQCEMLKKINLPEGLTNIGERAFSRCRSLREINLPKGLTNIEKGVFSDCYSLTSVTIPQSVTNIALDAFEGCNGLTIYCYAGSYAETYAKENNIPYKLIDSSEEDASATFFIDSTVTGELDSTITITGTFTLDKNTETSSSILSSEIKNITWTSSDSSIAEVTDCIGVNSLDNQKATLLIYVTPYKEGTVEIIGTALNGLTAKCMVTISETKELEPDIDVTVRNRNIIARVSEYTSDELYAQYQSIVHSDYSEEMKYNMYQSLFHSYGLTNAKEGIFYLSNTFDKRRAYLGLTTDEFYGASNFYHWVHDTAMGIIAQPVLCGANLLLNGEINDWLDFTTYVEADYPGVSKYKSMLYDFMDASSDDIESLTYIKWVSDVSENVTGAAKIKVDKLLDKLNNCSAIEAAELLQSKEALDVWVELAKDKNSNFIRNDKGDIKLTYKLDESSGFGQFQKAMGYATKTISIFDMTISDVMDLFALDSKLAILAQYERFLKDIMYNTEKLPFEMRWAAEQILKELEEGYLGKIKSIVWEIIEQTSINSEVLKSIVGKTASESFTSWLAVVNITSFFIDQVVGIGDILEHESYVEGYAALASAFTQNLEKAKKAFLADKTEENAWDFYYNYNILYRLRYKGEEAYLAMTKIKGFASIFGDFGYSLREEAVNKTLQMMENEFRFTLDKTIPIPESCQFATKSVIHCPVNVRVYAANGTLIAELLDGSESDITNTYGRFAVVYDYYMGDYVKVICLNSEENVSIQMSAVDDGLVSMELAQAKDDENKVYVFDNVPVKTGAVINTTVNQVVSENTYDIDTDGDGVVEKKEKVSIIQDNYVPIESVQLSNDTLSLSKGESSILTVTITPSNASEQKVSWMSADPSVATVVDGKVTAVANGSTTIYCMTLDDMDKMVSCKINVTTKTEDNNNTEDNTDSSDNSNTGNDTDSDHNSNTGNDTSSENNSNNNTGNNSNSSSSSSSSNSSNHSSSNDDDDYEITNIISPSTGKWIKDNIGWWYKNADNSYPVNRWQQINGKWYFFDKAGYMLTGWIVVNDKWYYLDNDGAMIENSWIFYKNQWYFLKGNSGDMATGWLLWKNQWYYLNTDGSMKTGWLLDKDNWYYLNKNGDMAVDCITPDGYQVDKNGIWIK